MSLLSPLYGTYERRLLSSIRRSGTSPRHIGVILDGNRRWAKASGNSAAHGHRQGAGKITELLEWSVETGVEVVTLWMLSTDNLDRDKGELDDLLDIIADAVETLAADGRWHLQLVGALDLLPERVRARLCEAVKSTADIDGLHVNIAVGYGGRHEIADAVKSFLAKAWTMACRLRRLPRTSPWSTSRRTSTRRASPTPTLSSARRASSASAGFSCGSRPTASSTSARPTGRTSGTWTSCGRYARTPSASAAAAANSRRPAHRLCHY